MLSSRTGRVVQQGSDYATGDREDPANERRHQM
jgi:hypothetical protein